MVPIQPKVAWRFVSDPHGAQYVTRDGTTTQQVLSVGNWGTLQLVSKDNILFI